MPEKKTLDYGHEDPKPGWPAWVWLVLFMVGWGTVILFADWWATRR